MFGNRMSASEAPRATSASQNADGVCLLPYD